MATKHKQTPANQSAKGWKIAALLVIAVFCLIVIGGLVRFYSFNASFTQATPEQMAKAKAVVENDLQSHGIDTSAYKIEPSEHVKRFDEASRTLIHVMASNETSRHAYLIDVNTGAIGMHSVTETADWMPQPEHSPPARGWFHAKRD